MSITAQAIIELDFKDNENKEEVELPEQLIKDYQDLNEKLEQTIVRIQSKRRKSTKTANLQK
jgi:hypothetical protein